MTDYRVETPTSHMLQYFLGRRTQVVKGEVCKTSMRRFESARRLQNPPYPNTEYLYRD